MTVPDSSWRFGVTTKLKTNGVSFFRIFIIDNTQHWISVSSIYGNIRWLPCRKSPSFGLALCFSLGLHWCFDFLKLVSVDFSSVTNHRGEIVLIGVRLATKFVHVATLDNGTQFTPFFHSLLIEIQSGNLVFFHCNRPAWTYFFLMQLTKGHGFCREANMIKARDIVTGPEEIQQVMFASLVISCENDHVCADWNGDFFPVNFQEDFFRLCVVQPLPGNLRFEENSINEACNRLWLML